MAAVLGMLQISYFGGAGLKARRSGKFFVTYIHCDGGLSHTRHHRAFVADDAGPKCEKTREANPRFYPCYLSWTYCRNDAGAV